MGYTSKAGGRPTQHREITGIIIVGVHFWGRGTLGSWMISSKIIAVAAVMTSGLSALPATSHAEWFARTDIGGRLVLTGIAVNPDKTSTATYLICDGALLTLEVLTVNSAKPAELPDYKGTKIVLGYKTREGDQRKVGLDGEPIISAGDALSIRASLTAEQSSAIAASIGRGYRLDVEIIHPELSADRGVKIVSSGASITALQAIAAGCPELKLR
ncbi:hypothetical protein [Rhizobium laguerreae]|uniref:hypothetical protein n=1 Tax=Rhizobium laguerreae TaxID=1076926 RepID=UPI0031BB9B9E